MYLAPHTPFRPILRLSDSLPPHAPFPPILSPPHTPFRPILPSAPASRPPHAPFRPMLLPPRHAPQAPFRRLSSESPGTSDSAATPTWHQSRSTCHYIYMCVCVTHKGDLAIFTTSSNSSTWRHNALGQHADRATTITSQLCLYPQRCQLEYLNEYNNKYIYV